jgi:hypothetical protein
MLAKRDLRWIERIALDPRPDLVEDTNQWSRLLPVAYGLDGTDPNGVFGALHGLRCLGARLVVIGGQARLLRGEIPEIEYLQIRDRWLRPLHDKLQRLLTMPTWAVPRGCGGGED